MSDEIRQRLPVIVGSAQVGYAPAPDSHQTELVHRATRAALADAGVSIEEVDTVISASDDVMDGRSISSVFLVEAMGGFLKEESKVEEDGSLALFYAALRFLAGSAEMALVVASSKASECDPSWYAYTSSEPICLRPLGVDDRLGSVEAGKAQVEPMMVVMAGTMMVTVSVMQVMMMMIMMVRWMKMIQMETMSLFALM